MSSPVKSQFLSFIKIDRTKEDAVYLQIVYQFINAVKARLLEEGDRLPGSRKITEELGVHRKTVVAAMAELQAQGWVVITPNIGMFVDNPELKAGKDNPPLAFRQPPEQATYHFRKEFILDASIEEEVSPYYFSDGTPDYRVIKTKELVRFYASALRWEKASGSPSSRGKGSAFFKEQLSFYLNLTRGFHISRNFLMPVAGIEQVLSILSRLLIAPGDVVLVSELSYFLPNMIFSQAGARLKTVPIDEEGMVVDYIKRTFRPGQVRCVYVQPQSQYPTTVELSEVRKHQLLALAERYGFVIIEVDLDFEFFSGRLNKTSLFRMDGGRNVLYIGAFGRFLIPGFQMNFLIAPRDVLKEAEKYLNIFGKPDEMMEKALGEMINQGDIHRYRRKAQKVVQERKMQFSYLLSHYFNDEIDFMEPASGLAFWVKFRRHFSLTQLQEEAKRAGLLLPGICLYRNRNITALRLGFAHLNFQEMEEAVRLLANAYDKV